MLSNFMKPFMNDSNLKYEKYFFTTSTNAFTESVKSTSYTKSSIFPHFAKTFANDSNKIHKSFILAKFAKSFDNDLSLKYKKNNHLVFYERFEFKILKYVPRVEFNKAIPSHFFTIIVIQTHLQRAHLKHF